MEMMPVKTELANAVTLAYAPHPFGMGKQVMPVLAGITIHQACINTGVDGDQPIVVFLNGLIVPVADWKTKTLNEGDFLTVQAEVTGGGGGGSNPLAVVAMIALTYFTMGAGAALWMPAGMAGTLGGAMLAGAAFMAGSMVINSVFAPSAPGLGFRGSVEQPSPTYSLTGGSNRMRPYEAMPLIMGKHRFFPDLIMRPYTEYNGQDQYLYQMFGSGLISAQLSDFRIGSTPLDQYSNVNLTVGSNIQKFPLNVDTQSGFQLSSAAGWIGRTGSADCYMMAIDIEAILFYSNDNGGLDAEAVELNIEWRYVGGAWQPFTEGYRRAAVYREECESFNGWDENGYYYSTENCTSVLVSSADTGNKSTISNNSQKPLRLTYLMKPPSVGQFEVRIRKVTSDSTEARRQNTVNVAAIRSYQRDNSDYGGQNRIALSIKASDQLNGAVAQLSCLASSRAQVWNGSAWVLQETSNPAHWFMDFCKGRLINGRLAYGLGLSNNQIDFTSLMAWAGFCNSEGLTFNAIIDGNKTAADVLQMIGRTGFGSPSWSSGKLGVVWDGRMQPPVAVFGMANIIKGSFNVSYLTDQLADEFVVSYTDPSDDYNQAQVRVANVATPINSTNIDLFGCTSRAMAGKFANYLAAQQIYRRRKVTWETDAEGFVCQRGDVVLLSHDLTQWGYSGRVLAISGSTVTLDRSVSSSTGNYLMVRHSDGSMTTHTTSTVGDASVLTVSPSVIDVSPLDCVYTFSPLATPGKRVKITSIQPINNHRLRIVATDDDAEFYAAWDGTFSAVQKQTLLSNALPKIDGLTAKEQLDYIGGFVVSVISLGMSWRNNVEKVLIKFRMNDNAWNYLTAYESSVSLNVGQDTGKLEIIATPVASYYVGESVTTSIPVYGKSIAPVAVTGFNLINSNGNIIASWNQHPDLDVRINGRFEIRYTQETTPDWTKSCFITAADGAANSAILPAMTGFYLIRAIDDTGNFSPVTSFYATEALITGFTTLCTLSGFEGVFNNTVYDAQNGLRLINNGIIDSVTSIDGLTETIDTFGGIALTGSLTHSQACDFGQIKTVNIQASPYITSYSTDDFIDLIADFDGLVLVEQNTVNDARVEFLISTSNQPAVSATDWTNYQPFIKGDFSARSARFMTRLSVKNAQSNISVNSLTITAKERA